MTRNIWIEAGSGTPPGCGFFLNPVSGGVGLRPQPPANGGKSFGFWQTWAGPEHSPPYSPTLRLEKVISPNLAGVW
jgi:hypothetical protein